ncbi:unnamed protein product [Cuscuta europaea]|uniref:Uncharacterized protein n=1 Tax=Cuscuta europaea TaxID=41803 RepID=A0A9P0ZJH7_CUSEU|nr:unnamed protein product [Cuscuta europaea]
MFSSNFASPSRISLPYSLFQNVPTVFAWSAPVLVQVVPLEPPPFSTGSSFVSPIFVGSPGVFFVVPPSRTPAGSPVGSLLTDLAQIISHVTTNVTNIVTTKLLAVEDYTTWRTQFESFLMSQALLGMVDGSIQESSSLHQAFGAAVTFPGQPTGQQTGQQQSGAHYPVGQSHTRSGNNGRQAPSREADAVVAGEAAVAGGVVEDSIQSSMVSRWHTGILSGSLFITPEGVVGQVQLDMLHTQGVWHL